MNNPFKNRMPSLNGPSSDLFSVTPSDSVDLEAMALALYIETGGTLVVTTASGDVRTVSVNDFSILPVGARRIHATGTTASGIHAFIVG